MTDQEHFQAIADAVVDGDTDLATEATQAALDAGVDPLQVLNGGLMSGAEEVGKRFERGEYFLPELMLAGRALKAAMEVVKPPLLEKYSEGEGKVKGKVVAATVQTDIHDIGKNIVALMFRNYGYRVVDLGKDVASERIVREIEKHKPDAVGLSALMTTTMTRMKEVIELARKQGERCPFLVGGAVVTKAYADSIGAEYARDGVEAVRVIERLIR